MQKKFLSLFVLLLSACTTVKVQKVDAESHAITSVCIIENPRVAVRDFLQVLEDGFARHNIQTRIIKGAAPKECEYTLSYTATRGWDFKPFMNRADLRLRKNNVLVASATYAHAGGLALNKWASTAEKMDPVIDELLGSGKAP